MQIVEWLASFIMNLLFKRHLCLFLQTGDSLATVAVAQNITLNNPAFLGYHSFNFLSTLAETLWVNFISTGVEGAVRAGA